MSTSHQLLLALLDPSPTENARGGGSLMPRSLPGFSHPHKCSAYNTKRPPVLTRSHSRGKDMPHMPEVVASRLPRAQRARPRQGLDPVHALLVLGRVAHAPRPSHELIDTSVHVAHVPGEEDAKGSSVRHSPRWRGQQRRQAGGRGGMRRRTQRRRGA